MIACLIFLLSLFQCWIRSVLVRLVWDSMILLPMSQSESESNHSCLALQIGILGADRPPKPSTEKVTILWSDRLGSVLLTVAYTSAEKYTLFSLTDVSLPVPY